MEFLPSSISLDDLFTNWFNIQHFYHHITPYIFMGCTRITKPPPLSLFPTTNIDNHHRYHSHCCHHYHWKIFTVHCHRWKFSQAPTFSVSVDSEISQYAKIISKYTMVLDFKWLIILHIFNGALDGKWQLKKLKKIIISNWVMSNTTSFTIWVWLVPLKSHVNNTFWWHEGGTELSERRICSALVSGLIHGDPTFENTTKIIHRITMNCKGKKTKHTSHKYLITPVCWTRR